MPNVVAGIVPYVPNVDNSDSYHPPLKVFTLKRCFQTLGTIFIFTWDDYAFAGVASHTREACRQQARWYHYILSHSIRHTVPSSLVRTWFGIFRVTLGTVRVDKMVILGGTRMVKLSFCGWERRNPRLTALPPRFCSERARKLQTWFAVRPQKPVYFGRVRTKLAARYSSLL